ncbi:MAG: DUF222 domain-containing protein, partial [Actinomycetes bacterium]
MTTVAHAHRLLEAAMGELRAAAESTQAGDGELLSVLTLAEGLSRQLDQITVATVATLQRRGTFTERGYKRPAAALADLLGWDWFEARRRVVAAEQACERVCMDGTVVEARLPCTGKVFTAGHAGLRHVEVIAGLLASRAAGRLTEEQRVGVEEQLAAKTGDYTPTQLRVWGADLIARLDQDGPEPDDDPDGAINELAIRRHRTGPGGTLTGRYEDAAMFDAIAALVDAMSKPLTSDDTRGVERRQAEALAEVCGWVLDHGDDVPDTGGRRPQLNVLIGLEDLEARARAATLDFGGTLTPEALRMLACDAAVIPIVMNGAGQPLDVGRATRVIPDGLRRAVTARDRGCAHPGCDRPPSWCEIHHILAWENGGPTQLDNLVMLCRAHHRLMHFSG